MAKKEITEFDTHSIAAADYLLFSNAAGTATYKTTLLGLLSNLTLSSENVGFTIAGGTTPKTLTLDTDITASLLTTTSTAILVSNLDTDGTLAANSDTKVPSQKAIKTYVDTNYVAMTGNQTVAGIKTFSSFPVSPSSAPTADYEMANKKYVDDTAFAGVPDATESTPGKAELATQAETDDGTDDERIVTPKKLATTTKIPAGVATALGGKVSTTGNETVNGVKTFGSIPVLPASDPTTDNQAVRKAYVDATAVTVIKGGTTTRNDSGTQTIAHGLGKTPKRVNIVGTLYDSRSGSVYYFYFNGTYITASTLTASSWVARKDTVAVDMGSSSTYIVYCYLNDNYYARATIAVDATNITLTWTKGSTGFGGVATFRWEAEG